jgi:hypothetical protein
VCLVVLDFYAVDALKAMGCGTTVVLVWKIASWLFPRPFHLFSEVFVDCQHPMYGLIALILLANWAIVVVLYMVLSNGQNALTKTLIYFVQVSEPKRKSCLKKSTNPFCR